MSHSWQQTNLGWRCMGCNKLSDERVPDFRGCMSPILLQPKENGRHVWMIENRNGVFIWKCCNCGKNTEEDIPPSHGCKHDLSSG